MSRVVHFEIHSSEPQRAIEFYTRLFGWSFVAWGPPGSYWLIRTAPDAETGNEPPGIDGGLVPRRGAIGLDGAGVNAFVCTVDVDDLDDVVNRAVAAGATIALPRMPIPGVGWLAYIKDTDNNILGLTQRDPRAA